MTSPDILTALDPVVAAFDKLSIPYFIGGSIASSIHGMARATMDIDIVADIREYQVDRLKDELENAYYIDAETIVEAIGRGSCFNLIHYATAYKIDVFIFRDEPHQRSALERRIRDKFDEERDDEYYFSAAEDIILTKLYWYVSGNKVSERQWLDILGVIKVQGDRLDRTYLVSWAKKLGLFELLQKAYQSCGIDSEE